jgi:uncharacterized protein (DUF433 family)
MSKRLDKLLSPIAVRSQLTPAQPHVHKLGQRLSDKTVAALLRDYSTGGSLTDLQKTYSLSRGSVQRLLRNADVRRRRKSLSDAEVCALAERYDAGLTSREIASEQALPKTTVQDALARAGIPKRAATRRPKESSDYRQIHTIKTAGNLDREYEL